MTKDELIQLYDKMFSKAPLRDNKWLREALCTVQNDQCAYCGSKMIRRLKGRQKQSHPMLATIDHILPRSMGGGDHPSNLVAACFRCNGDRGVEDASRFAADRAKMRNAPHPAR